MHPQALVLCSEIGVIGATGATGIRKDQDALFVIHEGLGFTEVGGGGSVLDFEFFLGSAHDPAFTPGDFDGNIGAKVPKCQRLWSSAPCTGARAARHSIIAKNACGDAA